MGIGERGHELRIGERVGERWIGEVALLVVIPSWCIGVAEIYERIESRSAMCKLTTVDSFYYV